MSLPIMQTGSSAEMRGTLDDWLLSCGTTDNMTLKSNATRITVPSAQSKLGMQIEHLGAWRADW